MDIAIAYSTMIVKNLEESVKFYTEVMQFKVDSKFEPKLGTKIALLRGKAETMLEIIEDKSFPVGLYSVGMNVENLETTVEELRSKGAKIILEITPTLVGSMAMIEDPNGIKFALIQHN